MLSGLLLERQKCQRVLNKSNSEEPENRIRFRLQILSLLFLSNL
jgi:hypothetical protein